MCTGSQRTRRSTGFAAPTAAAPPNSDYGDADLPDADRPSDATDARSLDAELDRTQMRECILRVVVQLPASQSAAILLGELRGFSDRELADALDISLGAAKIRLLGRAGP